MPEATSSVGGQVDQYPDEPEVVKDIDTGESARDELVPSVNRSCSLSRKEPWGELLVGVDLVVNVKHSVPWATIIVLVVPVVDGNLVSQGQVVFGAGCLSSKPSERVDELLECIFLEVLSVL